MTDEADLDAMRDLIADLRAARAAIARVRRVLAEDVPNDDTGHLHDEITRALDGPA